MFFLHEKISNTFKIDYDRKMYENALRDPKSKMWKKLSAAIELLVIVSVIIIIIESVADLGSVYKLPFFIIDYIIASIFAVEYTYRLFRAKSKKNFVWKPINIIDLLSFLPFFIWVLFMPLAGAEIVKVLRLFRILRLIDLTVHSDIVTWFFRTVKNYKNEYKAMISLFAIVLIIVSTLVYYVEAPVNPTFDSVPHSIWWGLVTMTAVGYWDMVPVTTAGRLLGSLLIFFWPVMLAVASAITILVFMDVAEWHKKFFEKNCSNCKQLNREDAIYCYNCWKKKFENIIPKKQRKRDKNL